MIRIYFSEILYYFLDLHSISHGKLIELTLAEQLPEP